MNVKLITYRWSRPLIGAAIAFSALTAAGDGQRVALLGDSMTWIGGDSCQNETGWSHWLKASGFADTIAVYARSGATWTNTIYTRRDASFYSEKLHDDNVIYNQALRLTQAVKSGTATLPDLAVIFAGANDAWFADRRPGIFSGSDSVAPYSSDSQPSEATTLQKSVSLVCDLLRQQLPGCEIVLVTPLEMSKASPEVTATVSEIIENAGQSRAIKVLRADSNISIRHKQEALKPTFTYDGVHTNAMGAKMVADYIISSLQQTDNSKQTTDK